jgi:molecular chaperone DnaK
MKTIGIDLGTTNTVMAVDANVIHQASDAESSSVVPSVVAFPPSGATLVGKSAKGRRAIDPRNTVFSSKRLMGQRWHSYLTSRFRKQYPFDLVEVDDRPAFRTRAGTFSPAEIGSRVMGYMFAVHSIDPAQFNAVITVPAAFEQEAREATAEAGQRAGLSRVVTVDEPVATARAYITMRSESHRHVAIYDLGGGTFDIAIIDCSDEPPRVICHEGDPYLGGDDIDQTVADWAAGEIVERFGWDMRTNAEVMDRLVVQCERAKIRLCFAAQTRIELSQIDPAAPMAGSSVVLTREVLEDLSRDLVKRTFAICDQVLRASSLSAADIDAVFLAGGATLMPAVRKGVHQYFDKLPRCEFDPMEVVSIGASLSSV